MKKGNYYPKGVSTSEKGTQFVFKIEEPAANVEIGIFAGEKELMRLSVPENCRHGQLYSAVVETLPKEADRYCYYAEGAELPDFYARGVYGMRTYGEKKQTLRYALPKSGYAWEEDCFPAHSYSSSVIYGLHVRGFTKHSSSGVRNKGTFAGIREKIPYLNALGITAVELMPSYEFDELEKPADKYRKEEEIRLNYWGFKSGYYYAPKSAYAADEDAVSELKDTVKALHKAGIEILLQFYFPAGKITGEIPDILHFWVEEYHIDGFHLLGPSIPASLLTADPYLKGTKLIFANGQPEEFYLAEEKYSEKNAALWRDSFTCDMRRTLKGDEGSISSMLFWLRDNGGQTGAIHTIAGYDGFTLLDMVSYEQKHNEANGEDNRDGSDYNFSWNCGAEGSTRKKTIRQLRRGQMRSALTLVFLSQGTPYLQSGDEFGQTQQGNNNPYCQDNAVTWLDWRLLKANREFYGFVKNLIAFRQENSIFRREETLRAMDYLGCGCPDISFHGQEAWKPDDSLKSRYAGVLYCGKYTEGDAAGRNCDFYAAFNMHWEPQEAALPRPAAGSCWRLCFDTALPMGIPETEKEAAGGENSDGRIVIRARSIRVYRSEIKEEI